MTGGTNTITFAIPGNTPIQLTESQEIGNPVIIDGGRTQSVSIASADTSTAVFQFESGSDGSTIKNLMIVSSPTGIFIAANNVSVMGCAIGTDYAGAKDKGNLVGILVSGVNDVIGSPATADRNIISGNSGYGIVSDGSVGLKIQGNYIGTGPDGNTAIPNQIGLMLRDVTTDALVGGNRKIGEGNLIAGNTPVNLYLLGDGTTRNKVCGNIVGANAAMTAALENHCGVGLRSCSGNFIGLPQDGFENIIVGQSTYAMFLGDIPRPRNNVIQNNYIGITPANLKLNNEVGIYVGADANLIGGMRGGSSLERNVFSGANSDALIIQGDGNTVSGNFIGTNVDGSAAVGNPTGIMLNGNGNWIGGENDDPQHIRGNVISGQSIYGIFQMSGLDNRFLGNTIGLNAAGDTALPNEVGIFISTPASSHTIIGGADPRLRNIISGNNTNAIAVSQSSGHQISGNYIGTNAAGTAVIRNNDTALSFDESANCIIGGHAAGERNVICGIKDGIAFSGQGSTGNNILGNWIGILPNSTVGQDIFVNGIDLSNSANANTVGVKEQGLGNLIVGGRNGLAVIDSASTGNGLFGNTITGFTSMGISLANQGNNNKVEPVITSADVSLVSGTSGAKDYIELFQASRGTGFRGGTLYWVGATVANEKGQWNIVPVDFRLRGGGFACALATDSANNTSKFSNNILVTGVNPTPTITPTGTPGTPGTPDSGTMTTTPTPGELDTALTTLLVFPNPAKTRVQFKYDLPENGEVRILLYNILGERVAEVRENQIAGLNKVQSWDSTNVAPGIYIARLLVNDNEKEKTKFAIVH
jgi:hypothetical protein